MTKSVEAWNVGDTVFTPNHEHDGVIVAVNRKKGTALVCSNYFAATMRQDFGVSLAYIRQTLPCKSIPMSDLVYDDED